MPGSILVAVVNICNATCGLWLGCRPLTEMPDASRPATIALRASVAVCGLLIVAPPRGLVRAPTPGPPAPRALRRHATRDQERPAVNVGWALACWRTRRPVGDRSAGSVRSTRFGEAAGCCGSAPMLTPPHRRGGE